MAKFEEIFRNFAFLSLLILALISLIVIVQNQNDAPQPLGENALINSTYGNLNDTIGSLEGTSSTQYDTFNKEKPNPGFLSIVLFGIVTVGKTFGSIVFTVFTLVIKIPLIVLGIDQTIVSMIVSFLTISVIIGLWLIYKFGG